jgi:hypothetical protein
MNAEFARDAAGAATVFAFFASSWFGWAQENPPVGWRIPLTVAAIFSILLATVGAILLWQLWSTSTALTPQARRNFGVIVGIEFASAGIGAVILNVIRKPEFVAPWIALIVGVHFFPLANLFRFSWLFVVGGLVTACALAAIPIARSQGVEISAVTGLAVGISLIVGALFSLRCRRLKPPALAGQIYLLRF